MFSSSSFLNLKNPVAIGAFDDGAIGEPLGDLFEGGPFSFGDPSGVRRESFDGVLPAGVLPLNKRKAEVAVVQVAAKRNKAKVGSPPPPHC